MIERKMHMSISKLAEHSGIPVSTIKFYFRKGLLPKPIKTGKTRAFYTSKHSDRLKLIRKIQEEGSLPLNKIREIVKMIEPGEKKELDNNSSTHRDEIIERAIILFREKGYEKTTIADIVTSSNIGRSTFYRNFRNKKELFVACFKKIFKDTLEEANGEVQNETDILMIFRKRAWAYYRAYPKWSDMINLLRAATINDPTEFADELEEAIHLNVNSIKDEVLKGVREKLFRGVNTTLLAVMLLGIVDYCCFYLSRGKFDKDQETILDQAMDIILRGIEI